MVLDAGRLGKLGTKPMLWTNVPRIVEFDAPKVLLQRPDGLFRSLVDGSADREELIALVEGGV